MPPHFVITSYSIHYTKLYEKEEYQRSLQDVRGEQYAVIFDEIYEDRIKEH